MRRSIHIGINAYDGAQLMGCVNDALDWLRLAGDWGYEGYTLLDGDATKANITDALRQGVAQTGSHDALLVSYSGHGSVVPDLDGDELDGWDEVWCPVDITEGAVVADDELFDIFSQRKRGSRVLVISDSCHAGTINRLAPPLRPPEVRWSRSRFLPPAHFLPDRQLVRLAKTQTRVVPRGRMRSGAATLAGCAPDEFCYDAYIDDRWNGSFTVAATKAFGDVTQTQQLRDLIKAIRTYLPSEDYPAQHPQLDATYSQRLWPILGEDPK